MKPWLTEPDRLHWIDPTTNLDCLIVRNPHMGHLCGYVGIPSTHPWYHTPYQDLSADVHGGLTFSSNCSGLVCHHSPPDTIAHSDVWWLGFDCAHLGDLSPYTSNHLGGTYKDILYVKHECESLAAQVSHAWQQI